MKQSNWHALTIDQALAQVKSQPEGLSSAEAALRLAEHGPNELQAAHRVSAWAILLEQFKNVRLCQYQHDYLVAAKGRA